MTALCAGARAWDRASLVLRVVALLATLSTCWAGDIVLIHGKRPYPVEEKEIQRLADFYGLKLWNVDVSSPGAVNRAIRSPNTLAVLSSLDALSGLDGHQIQAALRRWKTAGIPMLVFGVAARDDARKLPRPVKQETRVSVAPHATSHALPAVARGQRKGPSGLCQVLTKVCHRLLLAKARHC